MRAGRRELLRARGQRFLQVRLLLLAGVIVDPLLRASAMRCVEMAPLDLGQRRALALLDLLHRIEMRHLHERGDELEIRGVVVALAVASSARR